MSDSPDTGRISPYFKAASMPAAGAWAARRRLAAAMRAVVERMVVCEATEAELDGAAALLEAFADRLAGYPRMDRLWGFAESANAGDVHALFDRSPLIGLSNPLAPPMMLEAVGDTVRGRAVFGAAYEGPPGHVHGGWIAAAFDEVLGFAQSLTGNPGMTASLTVRYRRPTPLARELDFVGRVDRVDGRKIFTNADVRCDGEVTAEAEGLFVSVDPERFAAMVASTRARMDGDGD